MPVELGITEAEAEELQTRFREDPMFFFTEVLGISPWDKQIEIALSVRDHRETTTRSCHGIGKTFIAARIIAWYLISHTGSVVLTTAPTFRQVRELLWREIRTAYSQSKYLIGPKPNTVDWEFDTDWFALGLSTTEPDKFQGYHSDHLLVVIDEAAGVDEQIFQAIRGVTTSRNNRTLYLGNPTSTYGTFYDSHRRGIAQRIHISAWDTPNFTANQIRKCEIPDGECDAADHPVEQLIEAMASPEKIIEPYPKLISPTWVYERYFEWGYGSPMWDSRIEGDFPKQGENTLMSLADIEKCMDEDWMREHGWQWQKEAPAYGLDVARFGSDKNVLAPRFGNKIEKLSVWSKVDTTVTAGKAHSLMDVTNPLARAYIDVIGVGGGVKDMLLSTRRTNTHERYNVHGINVQMKAEPDAERERKMLKKGLKFSNLRARLYWDFAQKVNNHEILLPKDLELANDLAEMPYRYLKDGTIHIPLKEEIKQVTGRSPDRADAVVLSTAAPRQGEFEQKEAKANAGRKPLTAGMRNKSF